MNVSNVLVLTDYRGAFYSSTKNTKTLCTLDVNKIVSYFKKQGFSVECREFSQVDTSCDYSGTAVLYNSSEDYGLYYRSYIEDIILALKNLGAILIPDFQYLRAHHNKCYMELLRKQLLPEEARKVNTHIYGTYEEFKKDVLSEGKYVVKDSYGAGSSGVELADNLKDLDKVVKKHSMNHSAAIIIREMRRRLFWGKKYHRASVHNRKFIVQNYIDGLSGDYKVLKYGSKFYSLYRKNRDNDFRASGGGKLTFDLPEGVTEKDLLTFAKKISDAIGTPLCSMDIAWDGHQFILIEFQCLCFGPYTAEYADHYSAFIDSDWKTYHTSSNIEQILVDAITEHIKALN